MHKSRGCPDQVGRAVTVDAGLINGTTETYIPRTPLGHEIMEHWAEVVASGQSLIDSWEDLEREIAERRGGLPADET